MRLKSVVQIIDKASQEYMGNRLDGIHFDWDMKTTDRYIERCIDVGHELLLNAKYLARDGRGCVGLASNQLRHKDTRQFVAKVNGEWDVITDPILGLSSNWKTTFEGCLSLPKRKHRNLKVCRFECDSINYIGWKQLSENKHLRYEKLIYRYGDFTEFEGQVFQHEYDHLNGLTIADNHKLYYKENNG